jgi:hypothetical protein
METGEPGFYGIEIEGTGVDGFDQDQKHPTPLTA